MKILVTGCAGFIGAKTTELLLQTGHQVFGIDNLNDYYDVSLKHYRLGGLLKHKGFEFKQVDIESKEELNDIFQINSFDSVINLAARAGVRSSIETPEIYLTTNAVGTLNLLSMMVKFGVQKLVIASTSSLYANQPMPFSEDLDVSRPISPYAASKLAAESLAFVWHHLHGIDVTVLRYFTVYGPAGRPDMSPFRFCEWIRKKIPITVFGDGSQTRDFTYIDDIARGTVAALQPLGYQILNLGGGNTPLSINGMISLLENEFETKARIEYRDPFSADMKDTAANVEKAYDVIKWAPEISPQTGLLQTARWHKNNSKMLDSVNFK